MEITPLQLHNVRIIYSDITDLKVDAIVNSTNTQLIDPNNNCVDSQIRKKAGPELSKYLTETYKEGCETGKAIISPAFKLPCKYIIHTVVSKYDLSENYLNSLKLCEEHKIESIAFCSIGTGLNNLNRQASAEFAIKSVYKFLLSSKFKYPKKIYFCVYDVDTSYEELINKYFIKQDTNIKELDIIYRTGMTGSMTLQEIDVNNTKFSDLIAESNKTDKIYTRIYLSENDSSEIHWVKFFRNTISTLIDYYNLNIDKLIITLKSEFP